MLQAISRPSESLSKNIDFYVVYTKINILPTGNYLDQSQRNYDTVVSLVSIRAQPVINSKPYYVADLTAEGSEVLTGEGYVWKFAVEHSEIFALHNEDFEIVDGVYHLKAAFDDVEVGEDSIFVDGVEQNIEFKRFESL